MTSHQPSSGDEAPSPSVASFMTSPQGSGEGTDMIHPSSGGQQPQNFYATSQKNHQQHGGSGGVHPLASASDSSIDGSIFEREKKKVPTTSQQHLESSQMNSNNGWNGSPVRQPAPSGGRPLGERMDSTSSIQHGATPMLLTTPATDENFSSINWMEEIRRQHHENVQSHHRFQRLTSILLFLLDGSQIWLAAVFIGAFAGVLAGMTEIVTHWVTDLKIGVCIDYYWASEYLCCLHHPYQSCPSYKLWNEIFGVNYGVLNFFMYVLLATAFAGFSAWVCLVYAPFAAGSGIVEIKTILSGIRMKQYLDLKVLFIKCVGLCLSVGSGLTLGKEGPFVHVGCCISHLATKIFPRYWHSESAQRELISVGAGVGVAVAFGAPIGGVLFALEEVSYYFPHRIMLQAFFCAIISTLVLKEMDPTHTGRIVQFAVDYRHAWHWFELLPIAVIGITGGLVGSFINSVNGYWCGVRRMSRMKQHPILEACLLTMLTAGINYFFFPLRKGMLEVLGELMRECEPESVASGLCVSNETTVLIQVLCAGVIRMVLMPFTFGSKVPAGCFVPALFIGACFGRCMGLWVKSVQIANPTWRVFADCASDSQSCVIPGVYAIVGAAAVLAGVTRMTLCLVVIMFELTGGLEYVVPCMLVTILSKWTAELVGSPSIYEVHINLVGLPYLDPKEEYQTHACVSDIIDRGGGGGGGNDSEAEDSLAEGEEDEDDDGEKVGMTATITTTKNIATPSSSLATVEKLWNGMALHKIKEKLVRFTYKWYPVIQSETDSTLLGCLSAAKARQLCSEAESMSLLLHSTHVSFVSALYGGGENIAQADADRTLLRGGRSGAFLQTAAETSPKPSSNMPSAEHNDNNASSCVQDWSSFLDPCNLQVAAYMRVTHLLHVFTVLGVQHVTVTSGRRLLGIITRKDIQRFVREKEKSGRHVTGVLGAIAQWRRETGLVTSSPSSKGRGIGGSVPGGIRQRRNAQQAQHVRSASNTSGDEAVELKDR